MHNPLDQFIIKVLVPIKVFGLDISFSNSALMMFSVLFVLVAFFILSTRSEGAVPSRLGASGEMLYDMIYNMLSDAAGPESKKYFPFVLTLFLFVLACNMMSMMPYSFTVTSHVAITFALAIFIFICVTFIGFYKHGWYYFSLFLPSGVPKIMAPMLFAIELLSYLARPISLSIRLAANMMAGHVLLKVLASISMMFGVFGVFPFALLTLITGFEIFIAVLQAYIFSILTCVYLNDALRLH